jgi:hypothetical protein
VRGVGAAAAIAAALLTPVSPGTAAAQVRSDAAAARAERRASAGTAPAATPASPAEAPDAAASERARIRERLRAFYFDLGRKDWVALASDVLPAKIFASRAGPARAQRLLRRDTAGDVPAEGAELGTTSGGSRCAPLDVAARAESATISLDGDWAEVTVPSCAGDAGGADGFRLVRSGGRWRFVSFDLFDGSPDAPPVDRPAPAGDPGGRRAVSAPARGR